MNDERTTMDEKNRQRVQDVDRYFNDLMASTEVRERIERVMQPYLVAKGTADARTSDEVFRDTVWQIAVLMATPDADQTYGGAIKVIREGENFGLYVRASTVYGMRMRLDVEARKRHEGVRWVKFSKRARVAHAVDSEASSWAQTEVSGALESYCGRATAEPHSSPLLNSELPHCLDCEWRLDQKMQGEPSGT